MPDDRLRPRIRHWHEDDAPALFAAVRDSLPTLSQWLPWAAPDYDLARAQAWIAHCIRTRETDDEHHFGVFDTASGALLGGTGLNHRDRASRSANLGYWIAESARGRGMAVAGARQAARFGFERLGLQRIVVQVAPNNHASQRVAMKLGAVCEGIARNGLMTPDGPAEAIVHSLIPADMALWEASV